MGYKLRDLTLLSRPVLIFVFGTPCLIIILNLVPKFENSVLYLPTAIRRPTPPSNTHSHKSL
jgi:hypothetical protein